MPVSTYKQRENRIKEVQKEITSIIRRQQKLVDKLDRKKAELLSLRDQRLEEGT